MQENDADVFEDVEHVVEAPGFEQSWQIFEELLAEVPDAAVASQSKWAERMSTDAAVAEAVELMPLHIISNPRVLPWRLVPYIRLLGGDGNWYGASAFIVGPHHLATAGHNVFFHDIGGPSRVRVFPGRSGGNAIAALEAIRFEASAAWKQSADETRDYGVIRVAEDLSSLQAFTMIDLPSDNLINVAGYPSGDPAGNMWGAQARIDHVSGRRVGYPVATKKGQSGGVVMVPSTLNALGIHVRLEDFAMATRLTQAVQSDLMTLV
jgi:V8-like Glu-specific endopeptidase